MSILVHIECNGEYKARGFEGWGKTVIDFPGQSVVLQDFPKPAIIFEPPISRDYKFKGIAENVSSSRIKFSEDGDFSMISKDLKIFGKVKDAVLKEPDNHLTG